MGVSVPGATAPRSIAGYGGQQPSKQRSTHSLESQREPQGMCFAGGARGSVQGESQGEAGARVS